MAAKAIRVPEGAFVNAWHVNDGSPVRVAKALGITERAVYERRNALERRGIVLTSVATGNAPAVWADKFKTAYPRERRIELLNGSILVGSDAHIWPGPRTVAMQGFINAIDIVRPKRVCADGDWLDGARISRHGRIGWARTPTVKEELDATKAFTDDVEAVAIATDPECEFDYNMGNHCLRFDNYLSSRAGEMEDMPLMRLEDHFPRWRFQWSTLINGNVMIKHRLAGGIHAGYNNAMKGGVTMVTGHTHLLEAKPFGDYTGRRWGVQTGTLADLHGPQFEYHENSPSSACSGFAVLTFRDGMLMPPELAEVIDGRCYFRGEVIA